MKQQEYELLNEDNQELEIDNERKMKPHSYFSNTANSVLGTTVLINPFILRNFGYIQGLIYALLGFALTMVNIYFIKFAADQLKVYQYKQIVHKLYNPLLAKITGLCQVLFSLGTVVSFSNVIKASLIFIESKQMFDSGDLYKDLVLAGVMFLIILPVCYLKTLDFLKFNSYVNIFSMCILIIILFVFLGYEGQKSITKAFLNDKQSVIGVTCIIHTYVIALQYNFSNLYGELQNRQKNVVKSTTISFGFIFLVYFCAAYGGYFSFGMQTRDNIMLNISSYKNDQNLKIWVWIANIFVLIVQIVHFPVTNYNLRKATVDLAFKEPKRIHDFIVSTVVVVFAFIIGCTVKSIIFIIDFLSPLCGGFNCLVIPGLVMMKLTKGKMQKLALGTVVIGALVVVFSFSVAFYKYFYLKWPI